MKKGRGRTIPPADSWPDAVLFGECRGTPADARRLMSAKGHIGRLVSLFREDSSRFEALEWLKDVHTRALENRPGARELKRRILKLLNDGVL